MSGAATPTTTEPPVLDERDVEPRTPMKRLGSTRKLAAFSNIRIQLTEHTRVLEQRAEAAAGVASELSDYCRRRADLEHEYSRALDKLARAAHQRHKEQKHKREQWALTGAFACWQAALENTKALSRDHAALAELYAGPLAARLQRAADDALRLHRKCRDIVAERHEEVGAALAEAGAAGKAQAAAAADWRAAALKLRAAADQRARLAAADPPRHKKLKALDKELDKRRARYSEARAKALRARTDYALSLEAANATLQRYYLDDIADIMLCTEVGFEAVVGRCVRTAGAGEAGRARAAAAAAAALLAAADALDALADRQRVLDAHAQAFALPRPLPYQGAPPDVQDAEMRSLVEGAAEEADAGTEAAAAALQQRLAQLTAAARQLRAQCRESAKTLDAAEAELVKQMEGSEAAWDVSSLFGPGGGGAGAGAGGGGAGATGAGGGAGVLAPVEDNEAPRRDQEDYYLAKFRAYVSCAGQLARLESKAAGARARLAAGAGGAGEAEGPPPASPPSPPRRAAARLRRGRFAGALDGPGLPLVLTSCVRVISTYGLKHQGVFRVSGSQVEMQALRAAFERGEDPLADVRDASDINSVCGLLKMYLRELRPPLLPPQLQARLLRVAAEREPAAFCARLRRALAALAPPAHRLLRYLFAFLAHLAEYSEYNMMDEWNLAICLGPTLLAAWGEGGAQVAAQNLLNELVKRTIAHHAAVFPQHDHPHTLYVRRDPDEVDANAETSAEADAEVSADVSAEAEAEAEADADAREDLSLYDEDDDELSEDGESGEWQDLNSTENYRPAAAAAAAAAPAQAAAGDSGEGGEGPRAPESAIPSTSAAQCRRLAESTPDLVLDLPLRPAALPTPTPTPTPTPSLGPEPERAAEPAPDAADTFLHNRDTLKKRPNSKRSEETEAPPAAEGGAAEGAGPGAAGAGGGSPVPARNTARVCAKFAELTLTGGSLKPALAAKPALLRRPTPHPARPAPPLAPAAAPAAAAAAATPPPDA